MSRYSDASIDRVRQGARLEDIAGEFTELRRGGPDKLIGRCPLHDERTGSFTITPSRQLFHCFGCGAGGDVFDFVRQKLGMDFVAALEHLATRTGSELVRDAETPQQAARRQRHARLVVLLERATSFYAHHLWSSSGALARTYLVDERGLGREILEAFSVGVAPPGRTALIDAAVKAGFAKQDLVDAGLARRRTGSSPVQDRFENRIMFPTSDWRGKVVGFGARRLAAKGAKYVNSPQGALYRKGHLLYGASQARAPAAKAGSVIVVEGYTDVLAFHQAGACNTVAAMGTAITEEQVALLRRMAPIVVFVLDGDRSGVDAALRAGALARAVDLDIKVVLLPASRDPAEIAAAGGGDAVRELLCQSMSLPRFQVSTSITAADLSTAEGKDGLVGALRPIFETVPPSAVREELLEQVADALGFTRELVASWLTTGPPAAATAAPPLTVGNQADGGAGDDERLRLRRAIHEPERRAQLDAQAFRSVVCRRAAEHIISHPDNPMSSLPHDDHELVRLFALLLTT